MGCCISKCKPNTNPNNLQDKVVISQSPPPPLPPPLPPSSPPQNRKPVQSPPPSITSTSSFSCSTQRSTCGSSSLSSELSSCSSSVAFSQVDRLFSNEFLQSCVKENPQIIGLDPVKRILEVKQLVPGGNSQKRARAISPSLTRQKSFRVEKERSPNSTTVNGRSTIMRSPSPSRRFNGYTSDYQRSPMLFSTNVHNEGNRLVKANTRPMSPNRNKIVNKERSPMYLKNNKERFAYEIGSKVGVEVEQGLSKHIEDIDNPHIALDCFIFL
ncbi:hypothetical protein L6452_04102 [Arctium lappa]|uniref:Uncharacterized protein n=1 Tax=Arctium lappa TaxID=4217 RepID=A0ACB9FP13_ARCLA|nr:hypothetical protein L6452_04102 [Arctium lappa]